MKFLLFICLLVSISVPAIALPIVGSHNIRLAHNLNPHDGPIEDDLAEKDEQRRETETAHAGPPSISKR